MDTHVWPKFVRNMDWPKDGIMYSYEHRGYIRPEKVDLWLRKAFGEENAHFVVCVSPFVMIKWSSKIITSDLQRNVGLQ
jgi:hypothetical protein